MRLAPPFTDHAVLQRDQPIPVWGAAGVDEEVVVTLAGKSAKTTAGADGNWLVRLPPLPAGGPHVLVAKGASGEARISDVLVGEVWVCSGQSNMEWKLTETDQLGSEAECAIPNLRVLTVSNPARHGRQTAIDGRWGAATRSSLANFSAVGGWFGRELLKQLNVPIGMICNAWGGTRVQAWISREGLMRDPLGVDEINHYEGYVYASDRLTDVEFTSLADWEKRGAPKDTGNAGLAKGWAKLDFDDKAWRTMPVPSRWQDHGHAGSGVFWFRRVVTVPAAWVGRELEVRIGAVDKHDDTYVNGERVGGLTWTDGPDTWRTPRICPVPAKLVGKDGKVCVAVRARSHVFHGGMIGPVTELRVHLKGDETGAVSLAGDWRYEVEQDWGMQTPPGALWGPGNPNAPYTLFDSRVSPLLPYAIRGAIWYQGESNAHEPAVYRQLLPQMISDWRRAWGQGDFPFIQVQLANYRHPVPAPGRSEWAELRDAQTSTLADPNTGMAVAIDVGDADDIHPRDKRSVGQRLAFWALANTYGKDVVPSGPLFSSVTVEAGGRMRCRFRHGEGLRTRDGGKPQQVSIAGFERTFVWAESVIEGDTLVVWHPSVLRPASVRYAWADNPVGSNLVNAAGLPASPFRTDSW